MAALTAVRNPVNTKQSLLFYCSDDFQVALDTLSDKDGGKSKCPPSEGKNPCCPGGDEIGALVRHPGAFASLYYQDLVRVYGIRVDRRITQVSPAVEILSNDPMTNSTALACCGNQEVGWLYYLSMDDPAKLEEYDMEAGQATTRLIEGVDIVPAKGTTLCAYYDSDAEIRCCVYQLPNESLMYFQVADGVPSNAAVTNTFAPINTPMTAVVTKGTAYLYFVTKNKALGRVSRTGRGPWKNQVPLGIPGQWVANKPLAATVSADGSFVTIYQQKEKPTPKEKFRNLVDKLNQ